MRTLASQARPAGVNWYDLVQVVNTTTGQTIASATVLQNVGTGSLAVGASVGGSYSFNLPAGNAGAGALAITVTADYYNNVYEMTGTAAGKNNNSTTVNVTVDGFAVSGPDRDRAFDCSSRATVRSGR